MHGHTIPDMGVVTREKRRIRRQFKGLADRKSSDPFGF
jgi:hypothetical protein